MMHNPMKGPVEISKVGVVHNFISLFYGVEGIWIQDLLYLKSDLASNLT